MALLAPAQGLPFLTDTAPSNIVGTSSTAGTSLDVARADHTQKGVYQLIAGTGIDINPDPGFGSVTIKTDDNAYLSLLWWASGDTGIPTGVTVYITQDGGTLTEGRAAFPIPKACTVLDFAIFVNDNSTNTTMTYTIRKNGVNTPMSIAISAGSTGTFTDPDSADFSTNDLASLQLTSASGTGNMHLTAAARCRRQGL